MVPTPEVPNNDELSKYGNEVADLKKEVNGNENQETSETGKGNKKEGEQIENKEQSSREVHGLIHVGDVVIPDYADVASKNPAILLVADIIHKGTGLGVTGVRITDSNDSPENPISKVTVINPHWDKKIGEKGFVSINSEFAFIDKLPEGNGVTAKVLGSYDMGKGWNIEGTYFHGFNKGPDSDAFRAGITKKINDALSLTAQGWYKSDYDKNFFGRIIVDVNLGNGFGAQMSCIAKDGKLIPTMGVVYNFSR